MRQIRDGLGERAEEIGLEHGAHALHQRRHALEPHARVDRRTRQGQTLSGRDLLILHEHEVPELDEAVAVLIGASGRAAGEFLALIVEDFRTGAARAGLAHAPEIVVRRDADDLVVGESRDLLPQLRGRLVVVIDGHEQTALVEREVLGDQAPGELDRALLEIVAEREIAEHLEEGQMPRGVSDIVEVIVLAAGAHALLRRRRARLVAFFDAGEDALELHHAGVGEHQGRIVVRHQRRRRRDLVIETREIIEEDLPDVIDRAHGPLARLGARRPATQEASRARAVRPARAFEAAICQLDAIQAMVRFSKTGIEQISLKRCWRRRASATAVRAWTSTPGEPRGSGGAALRENDDLRASPRRASRRAPDKKAQAGPGCGSRRSSGCDAAAPAHGSAAARPTGCAVWPASGARRPGVPRPSCGRQACSAARIAATIALRIVALPAFELRK